jgi:hypothetical protein
MLQYLWCRDDRVYWTERDRIQAALIIMFLGFSGGRPGAFVVSGCHPGTHELLLYEVRPLLS